MRPHRRGIETVRLVPTARVLKDLGKVATREAKIILGAAVLDDVQRRLDRRPSAMAIRKRTVEHVFGTLKHWMGSAHFAMRRLPNVATEMSLHVLAYNLKRLMNLLGIAEAMKAMRLARA